MLRDRLLRFLNTLDRNVEIAIKPKDVSGSPSIIRVFAIART